MRNEMTGGTILWRAMRNGWMNRCPNCGEGRIWEGLNIHERCSSCNLEFEHDKASWGAFTWAFVLEGILFLIGIPLVELIWDLSFLQHVYLWTAFTIVFHLLFYRNMKGQWIGIRWAIWDRMQPRTKL